MVGVHGSRLLWAGTGEGWWGRAVAGTGGMGLVVGSAGEPIQGPPLTLARLDKTLRTPPPER